MKSLSELPDFPALNKLWKQEPVLPPNPRLELTQDSWVERGAEVIGWHLCRLEHWLSANGWLRAWFRLNLFVSIVLTIAGFLLLPPVGRVLEELANSSHWFAMILTDLLGLLTAVPPVIVSLAAVYLAFVGYRWLSHFRRQRRSLRGGEGYYQ